MTIKGKAMPKNGTLALGHTNAGKGIVKNKAIIEFISLFLLGSVPCFISVILDGTDGLLNFLKSINTSDTVLRYFIALSSIQFIVSKLGQFKAGYKPGVNARFKWYYAISNNIGGNLSSLYRVLAGAIFASAIVVTFKIEEAGLIIVLKLWVILPTFLVGAYIFTRLYNYCISIQR